MAKIGQKDWVGLASLPTHGADSGERKLLSIGCEEAREDKEMYSAGLVVVFVD